MSIQPVGPAEIDPSRLFPQPTKPGLSAASRGSVNLQTGVSTLNASQYSGSTAIGNAVPGTVTGPAAVPQSGDLVYMGYNPVTKAQEFRYKADARNAWTFLPDKTRTYLTDIMDNAFGKGKWLNSKLDYYWSKAVDGSNYAYYQQNQLIAVPEVFGMIVGQDAQQAARAGGGGGGSGGTSVTRQVRLTDPGTARQLVDQALSQFLGRQASLKEQSAFLKALNVQEAMAPTVTTTTAGGGQASSVTTGGFNPATFAQEWAAGQQGAAEYQAATTYLDTFINSLRAVV